MDILKAREKAKAMKKRKIQDGVKDDSIKEPVKIEEPPSQEKATVQVLQEVQGKPKVTFEKEVIQEEKSGKGIERTEELIDLAYEELSKPSFLGEKVDVFEKREYLSFNIGMELYAVDLKCLREIIKSRTLTEVPRVSHFISGVITLRGVIIPIIDLKKLLNLEGFSINENMTRIIVVEINDILVGFFVDRINKVLRIPSSLLEPPPPIFTDIDEEFIEYVSHIENKEQGTFELVIILNIEKVITEIMSSIENVRVK